MIWINVGVFLAVLVLGYFIGWSAGAVHALERMKEIVDSVIDGMMNGGMPDGQERADSESGV